MGAGCMLGPAPVCVLAGEGDGGDDGVLGVLSTVGGDGEGDCGVEVGVLVVDCGTEDGGTDGGAVGEVVGAGVCVGGGTGVGGIRGGGDDEGTMGCLPRLVVRLFEPELEADGFDVGDGEGAGDGDVVGHGVGDGDGAGSLPRARILAARCSD